MKKICFRCKEPKDVSEFYKHPGTSDGLLGKCKSCTRKDVAKNRADNVDYYREHDRKREQTPERKLAKSIYQERHRYKNTDKYKARTAVGNAIRDGRLIRPDYCSCCDNKCTPEAHHEDYSKPLEVVWMCRECHKEYHKEAL